MEEPMKIMTFLPVIKLLPRACVGLAVPSLGSKVAESDKDIVIAIFNIMAYDLFKLYTTRKRHIFRHISLLLKQL